MSTYSSNLRLELIGNGEQAGTWGTTTNVNLGTLLEGAISGYATVSVTSANQALTANNGASDEARLAMLRLTTTTTATFNVYVPPVSKQYVIRNDTAYVATIYNSTVIGNTTAAGLGVAIPAGKIYTVYTDGTNFRNVGVANATLADTATVATGMAASGLTGQVAVANGGTGAADAATARTNLGLGTISTQNANAVSISGGSISGITDLAVADGGTGASTAADARTNLGVLAIANNLSDLNDAAIARTNLGLGSAATLTAGSSANNLVQRDGSARIPIGTNWTVYESGGVLYFATGGVSKAKIDASGNLTVAGNVTAYGTI